jgi:hypothetical protein
MSDVPDDPESAGTEVGELDGCQALFEQEGIASLNYGTDSITRRRLSGRTISGAGTVPKAPPGDGENRQRDERLRGPGCLAAA